MFDSIPGLYPLDKSSISQSWQLKMSPDILPPRGKLALSWESLLRTKILNILCNINKHKMMYPRIMGCIGKYKTTWPSWIATGQPHKANIFGKGLWENSSRELKFSNVHTFLGPEQWPPKLRGVGVNSKHLVINVMLVFCLFNSLLDQWCSKTTEEMVPALYARCLSCLPLG